MLALLWPGHIIGFMPPSKPFTLRVTQASLNQTALDWPRNMANIFGAIDAAVEAKSDMLCFEELALTGYEVNDDFQRIDNKRIEAALLDIADYAQALDPSLIISLGHPWRWHWRSALTAAQSHDIKNPLYNRLHLPFNVVSVLANGNVVAMTAKTHLFNDERGYEKRYFNEWCIQNANQLGGQFGTLDVELGGKPVPFGRPVVHVTDGLHRFNLASVICEEKWVASQYDGAPHTDARYADLNVIPKIAEHLKTKQGLVLTIANASPPAKDKVDRHDHLNNLASEHADLVIDTDGLGSSGATFAQCGHRMMHQQGQVVSYGARMQMQRVTTTTATVGIQSAPSETKALTHACIQTMFKQHAIKHALAYEVDAAHAWDAPDNPHRHYEVLIRNTALWLFDYMRKTGCKGIMQALSGGADSAFNSVMVMITAHLAIEQLGVEAFCEALGLDDQAGLQKAFAKGGRHGAATRYLQDGLTTVYMGTRNSSNATRQSAEALIVGSKGAPGIGGTFVYRNVQELLDLYGVMYAIENMDDIEAGQQQAMCHDIAAHLNMSPHEHDATARTQSAAALKEKYPKIQNLVTAADGIAYENIQARGREVLIMLFANKENKMAIANPNLDEARNAYATFGGDLHSGTINLNAHIAKAYQLEVMQYLFEHGVHGLLPPVRALEPILNNAPSAELQPKQADGTVVQTDEVEMQRSFAQMDSISELMLHAQIETRVGARRLNASEVFKRCQQHDGFAGISDNQLFNMVYTSYRRWQTAQHKIHASPIAPTFGRNVDKQTSQRTPNLSGQSHDEIILLAMDILQTWASKDNLVWDQATLGRYRKRAWQNEAFVKQCLSLMQSNAPYLDVDLLPLYTQLKQRGWSAVFEADA